MATAEAKIIDLERLGRIDTLRPGSHPEPNGELRTHA